MSKYNQLAYLAFRINPDSKPDAVRFRTAYLPASWYAEAGRLIEERKAKMQKQFWQVPADILDNLLMACVTNITCASNPAWRSPQDKFWLYLRNGEPDSAMFQRIMRRWARFRLMSDPFAEESERILDAMFKDTLKWSDLEFDPSQCEIAPANGTAKLAHNSYRLLPNVIAERLCNHVFQIGNRATHFYRAPHAQSEHEGMSNAIELIEWPPRTVSPGIGKHFWSLVISISVQTVPFQPFVSIHCGLSIRRWIDVGINQSLGRQKNVTAFIFCAPPNEKPCFLTARAIRRKIDGKYEWKWTDDLHDLIPQSGMRHLVPAPNELLSNPIEFVSDNAIGVVYTHYIQKNVDHYRTEPHEAGTGFRPADRHKLFQQICERLAPNYVPVADSILSTKPIGLFSFEKNPLQTNVREKGKEEKIKAMGHADEPKIKRFPLLLQEARALVGAQTEKNLTVLVVYQEPSCADRIIRVLCALFGFDEREHPFYGSVYNTASQFTWQDPQLALTIHVIQMGNLGEWDRRLEFEGLSENELKRSQALEIRALEIAKSAPTPHGVCGAIVEIQDADKFDGDDDPKVAIRLGLARAGWVNQHLAYRQPARTRQQRSQEKESAESAVFDLLRQVGIVPRVKSSKSLDASFIEMDYLGFYALKIARDTFLPVAVRMNLAETRIMARARGQAEWLPYHKFLTTLPHNGKTLQLNDKPGLYDFVLMLLQEQKQRDTLVLLHKNSLGHHGFWSWMNNDQITRDDHLVLGGQSYDVRSQWNGKIRIAWVHEAGEDNQVPQCYGKDDQGHISYGRGLYQLSDRLFRSVAEKPVTQKNSAVETSKYDQGVRRSGKYKGEPLLAAPGDHAWNPIPVEILIAAMQDGDEAGALAWAIHQLRSAFIHFEDQTRLPAPLHFAKQATEYQPLRFKTS